jgi:exodeoxyribonuclease V alpha subunit
MTTLLATGTVRAKHDPAGDPDRARRMALLSRTLEELNVPGHRIWLVDRMLDDRLAGASAETRWHVQLGLTALVAAVGQGSSGLPLEETDGEDLRSQVATLLATAERVDEAGEGFAATVEEVWEGFAEPLLAGDDHLQGLIGPPEGDAPFVRELQTVYSHKMAALERRVADGLGRLIDAKSPVAGGREAVAEACEAVLGAMPFVMTDEERADKRETLQAILDGRFGVISGGAGTGKTTLVLSVLRVLDRLAPADGGLGPDEIALAAPTGKAAHRLQESIDTQIAGIGGADRRAAQLNQALTEPQTLHRLLDYSPYFGEFRRGADRPLTQRLVVVDEASMVGLELMEALVAALPDDGRLLLVGDAGQLPSVQAGAVYHDLSEGSGRPAALTERVTRLTESHRTADEEGAEQILEVADRLRDDRSTSVAGLAEAGHLRTVGPDEPAVSTEAGVRFVGAAAGQEGRAIDTLLSDWWTQHYAALRPAETEGDVPDYRRRNLFTHTEEGELDDEAVDRIGRLFTDLARAQLLCITRRGTRGSEAVNRRMHRRYVAANDLEDPARFEAGEPVMITRNDYDEQVFNGDQGLVLYTRRPGARQQVGKQVVVPDGDGFRAIPFDRLRDKLELAYALTVHKSQGSEYDHVGLLLPELLGGRPDDDRPAGVHPLVTREILYTGITRAKASVTLFGGRRVFDEGSGRSAGRYSGVGRRLAGPFAGGGRR